jgi:hypothetical protein
MFSTIDTLRLRKLQSYRCPVLEQEAGSIGRDANPLLGLNLTVWLMRSAISDDLNSRATNHEVRDWVGGVVQIYLQANVQVHATVNEIVVPAAAASNYEQVARSEMQFLGWRFGGANFDARVAEALGRIIGHNHNAELGWHLFLAHNLPFCGVALNLLKGGRGRGCTFARETGCMRVHTEPYQVVPVLIAHELGHTLSLEHVDQNCNLMSGLELMNGPLLTPKQSLEARAIVKTGRGVVWDEEWSEKRNGVRGRVCSLHSQCSSPLVCGTRKGNTGTCFCTSPEMVDTGTSRRLSPKPMMECQNEELKKEKVAMAARQETQEKAAAAMVEAQAKAREHSKWIADIKAKNLAKWKRNEAKKKAMLEVLAGTKKAPAEWWPAKNTSNRAATGG